MNSTRVLGVEDPLLWFAGKMREELDANSHKSGWSQMSDKQLLQRLEQEVGELRRALLSERPEAGFIVGCAQKISEAADVANFAMMIADNLRERLP